MQHNTIDASDHRVELPFAYVEVQLTLMQDSKSVTSHFKLAAATQYEIQSSSEAVSWHTAFFDQQLIFLDVLDSAKAQQQVPVVLREQTENK